MACPQKSWTFFQSNIKSNNTGLKINDVLCFDKATIAEHFNNFFTVTAIKFVDMLLVVGFMLVM